VRSPIGANASDSALADLTRTLEAMADGEAPTSSSCRRWTRCRKTQPSLTSWTLCSLSRATRMLACWCAWPGLTEVEDLIHEMAIPADNLA